ncbi:MAG: DUF4339 domain-containing protein, partial [Planctomycetia bacterium]
MPAEWFYTHGNDQRGPIDAAELQRLAAVGELRSDDYIWRKGMAEWRPAGDVSPDLFSTRRPAPAGRPTPIDSRLIDARPADDNPFAAPRTDGPSRARPGGYVGYGGFFRRFVAFVLDAFIAFLPCVALTVVYVAAGVIPLPEPGAPRRDPPQWAYLVVNLVNFL